MPRGNSGHFAIYRGGNPDRLPSNCVLLIQLLPSQYYSKVISPIRHVGPDYTNVATWEFSMYNLICVYKNKYYYICSMLEEAPLHTIKNVYAAAYPGAKFSVDDLLNLRQLNLNYKNSYEFNQDYRASNHLHEVIHNG